MDQTLRSRLSFTGLFVSMFALMWILRAILMSTPPSPAPMAVPAPTPKVVAKVHPHRVIAVLPKVTVDPNTVPLHSIQREYTYVFKGKVTCGTTPCRDAAVKVHVQTDRNPAINQDALMGPDGNYTVVVLFKDAPNQQINWKISADSKDSEAQELHGQQILDEEPQVVVEEPIRLL